MSKTFAPSSRSQSTTRGRGRGRGNGSQTRTATASGPSSSSTSSTSRSQHSNNQFGVRGRGNKMNSGGRGRSRGIGNGLQNYQTPPRHNPHHVDNSVFQGLGASASSHQSTGSRSHDTQADETPSSNQRGQYASGFTKFEPNMRKRQQVNDMANRETRDYERYKQENAVKYCSYVGTTGGGEMTEDMVRRRQANEVRGQKVNRMLNRERRRSENHETEQREIDLKRAEARRKADQNARADRPVNPEEIRRKREDFLRQLESGNK